MALFAFVLNGTSAPPVTDGLVVWMDGNQVTTEVEQPLTPLVRWPDQSGHGNHAGQSVLEAHPHPKLAQGVTPAGGDAVRFDNQAFLDVAASMDFEGLGRTWYVVFRDHGGPNHRRVIATAYENPEGASNFNDLSGSMLTAGNHRTWGRTETGTFTAAVVERTQPNDFAIAGGVWDEAGDVTAIWVDKDQNRGVETVSGATAVPSNHIATRIGAIVTPALESGSHLEGDIAEIVYYNRTLTEAEQDAVETYLYSRHFLGQQAGELPASGLVLWLDATQVELDEAPASVERVVEWTDQSGRNNHAVESQTADGGFPLLKTSATPTGQNALVFDGAEFLEIPSNPADLDGPELTWYIVFRPELTDHGRLINSAYYDLGTDDYIPYHRAWLSLVSSGDRYRAVATNEFGEGFVDVNIYDVLSTESFAIGGGIWNANTAEIRGIVVDSFRNRFVESRLDATGNPISHMYTRIGAGSAARTPDVVGPLTGEIAEILIYNRVLSEQEQASVETYLADKHLGEVPATGFQAWQNLHFDGSQLADPAISGPDASPAGDGISNLLKYASGIEPWAPVTLSELIQFDVSTKVLLWPDLSGRENHAGPSLSADHALPEPVAGATPAGGRVVRFDKPSTEYLEIPGSTDFEGSALTWYVVARANTEYGMTRHGRILSAIYGDVGSGAWAEGETLATMLSSNNRFRSRGRTDGGTSAFTDVSAPLVEPGNFVIGGSVWDSATGLEAFFVDQEGERHANVNTSVNGVLSQHRVLRIGGTERYFDGDIAEVLFYNRALTEQELTAVEDYLYTRHFTSGEAVMPVLDNLVLRLDAENVVTEEQSALTFRLSKELPDVEFVVEVSEDLVSWVSGPEVTEISSIVDEETTELITVVNQMDSGESGRAFMRLKLILNN